MIDIHTHILPHMDDGSSSVRMSIEMLRELKKQGIFDVALTSHFYPEKESIDSFLNRRTVSYEMLSNELPDDLKDVNLYLGAEVAFFDGIEKIENIECLKIDKINAVLLEMPFEKWTESVLRAVIEICNVLCINVILAHVERYFAYGNFKNIEYLEENGIMLQVNSSFINDLFVRGRVMRLYKQGKICYFGSDCHNMTKRPPSVKKCVEKLTFL